MSPARPAGPHVDAEGRVVVITGATSGIGKEAAVAMARRGATVVLACRNPTRTRTALAEVRRRSGGDVASVLLDLASLASVRACAAEVLDRWDRLDVLVNNAGGVLSDRLVTDDGFEMTFGVNHLGPFLLTDLLLDRLRSSAPARIVNVASVAHRYATAGVSWASLDRTGGYRATDVYAESKLANVLLTLELARRLEGSGVTATCCHPGAVRSGFGADRDTRGVQRALLAAGRPFFVSPRRGAAPLISLALDERWQGRTGLYVVGGYVPGLHVHRPSRQARDEAAAAELWRRSQALVATGAR